MGRTPCCSKDGMNKGPWTAEEDRILTNYIKNHGEGKWRNLPKQAGLKRCGKSCRLRWLNYLRPDIKRGNISEEEEDLIIRLHKLLGNRWSLIAGRLPGRTDNEVKNYWNTTLRKKVKLGLSPDQKSKEAIITNMISKQSPNKTQLATSTANNIHVQAINQGPNAVRTKPSECSNTEPVQEHENRKDVANTCEDNMSGGNLLNLDVPMDNFVAEEFLQSDISDSGHDFWKLCSVDHNHHEFDFNVINDQALLDGNNFHSVRSDGGRFPSSSCQPIFFPEDEMLMKYWTDFRDD